MSPCQFN